jgi:hypothetical protein
VQSSFLGTFAQQANEIGSESNDRCGFLLLPFSKKQGLLPRFRGQTATITEKSANFAP